MSELVYSEFDHGIATIFLNNPPLNVVSLELTKQLWECLVRVEADPTVRVIILTGVGSRAFCAGSDIKEFRQLAEAGTVIERKLAKENFVYDALDRLPKPTIAAINGMALGGGAELAMCCDLRVMDEVAQIGFPECKLGVFPGSGGTQRLPRLVGEALAKELMFIGDPVNAERAFQMRLVNRIAPPGRALSVARCIAQTIAGRAGLALACAKEAIDFGLSAGEAAGHARALQLSDRVFRSEDIKEGVAAFFEKRPPNFQHC